MKMLTALMTVCLLTSMANSSSPEKPDSIALSMIPHGKIIDKLFREYTVKTKAGTKIKLEFERDGKFQEAFGLNLNHGDDFEPGQNLKSLSSVAQAISKLGHQVRGPWKLEKDSQLGWVYELSGESNGAPLSFLVEASTGKLVSFDKVSDVAD